MRAALAKWLLASWLRCHVRTNEAWRVHGSMGALSQRAAKLIHIDLNSLLVPKRFHAPRFAQYRDKSFNESTSHVHVSLNGICQTATDSIHTINTSFLSLLLCVSSSFVRSIKRSTDKEMWIWVLTLFSQSCCSLFFDVEDEPFECVKTNANAGRCLWISPARRLY